MFRDSLHEKGLDDLVLFRIRLYRYYDSLGKRIHCK